MTTGEGQIRKQVVAAVVTGVVRKTSLIVSGATCAVVVFNLARTTGRWWFVPASILFGGALGLLNFRWLAISVERVYLKKGATPVGSNLAAAIIGILKLSLIFIILFIVIKWQLLNIFGLVAGLTLCFLAILWQGATAMKQAFRNDEQE